MENLSNKKFEKFQIQDINSIYGGRSCNDYTQQIDYTDGCTVDDECWVCDEAVASK